MTSDDVRKYLELSFAMDCPRMVLRRNSKSSEGVFEGPGSIYQTSNGGLRFKLFASGHRDISFLASYWGAHSKAGEIIPLSEYFSLEATDPHGTAWRSEFILPGFNQGADYEYGPIVTGSLHELRKTTAYPSDKVPGASLSLIFGRDFDFPGNASKMTKTFVRGVETSMSGDWTTALFEEAGTTFTLEKENGTVFLSAESKEQTLPHKFDLRICEALQFALFDPVHWVIRTRSEKGKTITTLRPFPKDHRSKGTHEPPISFHNRLNGQHVWNLFAKYLKYVITCPETGWHPLSRNVHFAVAGNSNPLDTALLTLSVAVEGILKTGFPKLAVPIKSLRGQIDAACELVASSSLDDSFKLRLNGALTAMKASRAKDKLLALQRAGVIREGLVHAWEDIRHPSVHADGLENGAAITKIYSKYHSARTLFNELVFLVIGYTGPYTDYSVSGWPQVDFQKSVKDVQVRQKESSGG